MPIKEHSTTVSVQTELGDHGTNPIRPVTIGIHLIVRTLNCENIIQIEGPGIRTDAASATHNFAKASLIPSFYLRNEHKANWFWRKTVQFRCKATAPMPRTFLRSTHSVVTLRTLPLFMNSMHIPRKTRSCESPSVKTVTKGVHISQNKELRIILNVVKRNKTPSWKRCRHGIKQWDVQRQQRERMNNKIRIKELKLGVERKMKNNE